jgi:hypothetical protein
MKEQGDTNTYLLSNKWGNGSFEQFAYYQRGLPVISMNVFPYLIKKENKDGKETKELTTEEKTKLFLAYADSNKLDIFVPWIKVEHPDFPDGVEVGGLKPFATTIPIADSIQNLCEKRIPFLINLMEQLPTLQLSATLKESKAGISTIEVFVTNKGALPYPIAIGERNETPAPLILICDTESEILSGRKRTPLGKINPLETKQFTYIVKNSAKNAECTFQIESKNITTVNQPLKLAFD